MNRLGAGTHYTPIWFFVAYIGLTLGLALFGPVDYIDFPKLKVVAYIAFVVACCGIGYHTGIRSYKSLTMPPRHVFEPGRGKVPRAFNYFLAFSVLGLAGYLATAILTNSLNADVTALGETYNAAYKGYQRNTGSYSLTFIVYSLSSIPMFVASIWGLYYFKRLNSLQRWMTAIVVFGTVLVLTLTSGKMKTLGDFLIYVIAIAAMTRGASGKGFHPRFIATISIFALLGLMLLGYVVSQRYSFMGVDATDINQRTSWHIKYNTHHPVFRLFGLQAGFTASVISNYLSGGYYGLGLTLNSAPTWSHFMGTSYSISVIGERIFGLPSGYLVSYPYLTGVETGWGESHWYTVFPWFASDFTFIGTGALFGVFAFWYARAWLECIILADRYAILLFSLMTVGVFYAPANNQTLHAPGAVAIFCLVVGLYVWSGSRRQQLIRRVWDQRRVSTQRVIRR